jgi:hypothetical protein
LISWNEEDGGRRARELEQAGVRVNAAPLKTSGLVAQLKDVAAVCIDLDRLPSHGREVAAAIRNTKALRHVRIVFAGGPREKVFRIKKELPDAVYTDWPAAPAAIRKALRTAPKSPPVAPPPMMQRYAGRSLQQKLGLTPETTVAWFGAPESFKEQFGDLALAAPARLTFWFVRDRRELEREVEFMAVRIPKGGALWIAYHKGSLTQNDVRKAALAAGLVDYKVCAIDAEWSGLKFARKKTS